jgi:phosphatidylserine synthase
MRWIRSIFFLLAVVCGAIRLASTSAVSKQASVNSVKEQNDLVGRGLSRELKAKAYVASPATTESAAGTQAAG